MNILEFHKDLKKTKLELGLEEYSKKIERLDEENLEKELSRVNKKLVAVYILTDIFQPESRDISQNSTEKNRLYMRKVTSEISKWVGCAIKQTNNDFSGAWRLINATFVSQTTSPDYKNKRIKLYEGVPFMDLLSLNGLQMYKKYMLSIANSVLFEKKPLDMAIQNAKKIVMALNEFPNDLHFYADAVLPRNWQTYYKYAMKQKIVLNKIKTLQKDGLLNM